MKEVEIHYQRIENEMIFAAEARKNPQLFEALQWTFVSKPSVVAKSFPVIPKYDYKRNRGNFSFASLLTRAEVIDALARVRQECNKVIDMTMFDTNTTKPLRLEEFEQRIDLTPAGTPL